MTRSLPVLTHILLRTISLLLLLGLALYASGQALTITGLSPARNARSAPTTTNVSVTFDKPLSNLPSSLSGLRVFSARRGGLLVNGRGGGVSVSGSTMIFNPTTDFRPGETVFVTGTMTIQGSDGSRLNRGQVYGFTTGVGGDGQGNFIRQATNPMLAVGQLPYGLALGDVDGDGDLDFVTASGRNDVVGVWLNNGSGNFGPPATNPNPGVGLFPVSVVLGDVDGDGDLDLLSTNQISGTVSVRLNNGLGNFTPPATNPNPVVGSGPTNVALGDVDGDGDLDFVTANGGGSVSVRLNDGSGNFTPPATNPNPEFTSGVNSVALGDVDGDGDLDFVTANDNGTASVRLNNGSGNFTPPATNPDPGVGSAPRTVVLGDVDGDGDLDLLTANYSSSTVSVRLNNGSGNFIPPAANPNPAVRNGTWGMALGDVDGDGDLDFVTANDASGNVSIRLNNGSGNFTPPATNPNPMMSDPGNNGKNPQSVALGDVDGDGDLDLLCINRGSSDMMVRINKTFPPPTLTPIRYVRVGASGSGNSWADASGDLQSQINFTGAQQVWVAAGTYKPGPAGNTNRTSSFSMKDGVAIYGGFAGTETSLSERVLANPLTTILSGDIGTAGNSADNSYHVINNPPGLFNSAVLDGFLITGGNANASSSLNDGGGGMLNNSSGAGNICTPLISNCLFVGNSATTAGGAIYNAGFTNGNSSPTLINCAFQGNAAGQGGAIFNDGSLGGISSPSLTNCSFQANSAGSGGAMSSVAYQGTSRPTLTNSVVWGNGGSSTFSNQQGALITTSYNLFESSVTGYSPGTGNLTTTTSPFLSATSTQLNGCTPALNSGDNAAYTTPGDEMPPTTDLAGNARVFPSGGRIDMGAYEYQTVEGLSLSVPSVNKATLGVAFSQPFSATGGTSPYSYSLASGSLPTGLSLASTGVLSGTPTQVGSFTITVKATDVTGCSGVSAPYGLTVDPGSPIRYVRAGASGSGNSWADASGDLQRQINVAGAQQVWVATGTYRPTSTTDRSISFSMKNGVAIYGGFAGSETALAQRNPTSLTTVLSGNIGNAGSNTDNTYHVFSHPRELALNSTAVLDGFVIRDGYDTEQNPYGFYGGGMYNDHSSPTVTNCNFLDNTSFLGGGMYNIGTSSPTVTNCSFRGNTAINTGGGMYNNVTSNPMLTNCSFVGNRARFGGGMGNDNSSPVLTNCSFVSNTASDTGGGMFNATTSNPTLVNCSFLGNSSVNSGGGMYNQDSSPTLTNCVLFGNGGARTFSSRTGFSVTYSLLEPAVTGYTSSPTNLITTVSPFVSATDARLNGCSPAINAGNNAANSTATDLAGNPRRYNGSTGTPDRIDMGAYEYQAAPTVITTTVPGVSTATVGVGFSQDFVASGGSAPYSYSLASGSLPTGLSLASTGTLSGTTTQVGSFTLTVLATDANGCSGASAPYVLTVSDAPSPNPTLSGLTASPGGVCVGSPVSFTATAGNVTGSYGYTLTNGLGTSLSGTASGASFSQSVTASGTGTQTFTLTVGSNGQSASSVTTLMVNPLPVASLTNDGPLSCAQPSVTLTAGGAAGVPGNTYTFVNGSGVVIGTPGPANTIVVSSPGAYSVTVASASGCVSTTSTVVTADQNVPTVSINTNSATLSCASPTASLTAVGMGSVRWSTGETIPIISVSVAGTYSVTLTSANGCSAVTSANVSQDNTAPVASLVSSSSLTCSVTSVTLTANPSGQNYTFSGPGVVSQSGNTAVINASGLYSVTVVSGNGCSSVASTSVSQNNTAPVASLVSSGSLSCSVTSVTLTAGPGGQRYVFSSGANQVGSSNQAVVGVSGSYSVTVLSGNGCSAVGSTTVVGDQRIPIVSISANPSLTIVQGQSAILTAAATSSAESVGLRWSTGQTSASISVSVAGTYSVSATAANGCSATSSAVLTISDPVVAAPFAITSVTTLNCIAVLPNRYSISFTPRYSGLTGQPISFSVVNELLPTTEPGPYTIQLYTDNSRITLSARQTGTPGEATYVYDWLAACLASTTTNTPPRLVTPVPSQSTMVGVGYNYVIPAGTFTDDQTPGSLLLSAQGLPPGIRLTGYTLSGVALTTVGSPFSVTLTATDPGNLRVSTSFGFTVTPASVESPQPTVPFAITGVSLLTCTPIADRININFTPRYAGLNGQAIAFSVVNELAPTSEPGPYSLILYRDNPVINLRATQTGSMETGTFAYNWLAACVNQGQDNTPPVVVSPIAAQMGIVGQSFELNISNIFIDQETPASLRYSVGGLPAGLSLTGTRIAGVPQTAGVSSVTLTATDGGGLSTSTGFTLTISQPGSSTQPTGGTFAITGVQTLSCVVVSSGLRSVTFLPIYGGVTGQPISFSVVNEKQPTTDPGPYTLSLYTDNPTITLKATQTGTAGEVSYRYAWLTGCPSGARPAAPEAGTGLQVTVLGNPIVDQQVELVIRGVEGQRVDMSLVDLQGVVLQTHRLERAATVDRVRLAVGTLPAQFMLQVSTTTERQTLKLIKP